MPLSKALKRLCTKWSRSKKSAPKASGLFLPSFHVVWEQQTAVLSDSARIAERALQQLCDQLVKLQPASWNMTNIPAQTMYLWWPPAHQKALINSQWLWKWCEWSQRRSMKWQEKSHKHFCAHKLNSPSKKSQLLLTDFLTRSSLVKWKKHLLLWRR